MFSKIDLSYLSTFYIAEKSQAYKLKCIMKPSKILYKPKAKENIFDHSKSSNEVSNLLLVKNDRPIQKQQGNFRYEKSPKSYQLNLYDNNCPQNDTLPKEIRTSNNYLSTSQAFNNSQRDNLQPTPNSIVGYNDGNFDNFNELFS